MATLPLDPASAASAAEFTRLFRARFAILDTLVFPAAAPSTPRANASCAAAAAAAEAGGG